MKKVILFTSFMIASHLQMFGANISITVSSYSSSNNTTAVQAKVGDVVTFVLTSSHTATEISQSNWNQGIATSNGGFDFDAQSSSKSITLTANDIGTIYFACKPHIGNGMKGMINVAAAVGIENTLLKSISLSPNPTTGILKINSTENFSVEVFNIIGTRLLQTNISNGIIDISSLTDGVYMIYLKKDEEIIVTRVIKN